MTQDSRAEKPRLYTEAELQAAIAAAMMEAVKPLEWFNIGSLGDIRAQSIVGRYEIIAQPNGSYSLIIGARSFWNETLAAAKSAAQADYQARILSALSIRTDGMAALEAVISKAEKRGRDAALEEALAAVSEVFNGFQNHASDAIKSIMEGGE